MNIEQRLAKLEQAQPTGCPSRKQNQQHTKESEK